MAEGFVFAAPAGLPGPGRGPRSGGRGRGGGAGPPPLLPAVLGAGAAPEEAPLVDLEALDAAAPERFYLPDAAAFAALADCYAVVDGARLPLHSPVLALQSSVLRQVVLQFCGAGASQEPIELSSTFAGCSLRQAAVFVRLVYRPDHATAASLGALHRADAGLLPALVRLAHRLDAAALLAKLEACLQDATASAATPELLSALQLAEAHYLESLRAACLQLLAQRLAGAGPFWREQASAEQLAACSSDSLARLVGEMAGAVQGGHFDQPAVFGVGRGRDGKTGGFAFVVRHFSRQSGRVQSPWVEVGGLEWRVKVWPQGDDNAGGTHLSAYLEVNAAQLLARGLPMIRASYEFAFLDQSGEGLHYTVDCGTDTFAPGTANWGKTRMVPLEVLRAPGRHLLDHDRLAIRVTMRVVPPPPAAAPVAAAQAASGDEDDSDDDAVAGL